MSLKKIIPNSFFFYAVERVVLAFNCLFKQKLEKKIVVYKMWNNKETLFVKVSASLFLNILRERSILLIIIIINIILITQASLCFHMLAVACTDMDLMNLKCLPQISRKPLLIYNEYSCIGFWFFIMTLLEFQLLSL